MNNLKTAVLLAALSGLLIAVGGALGGMGGVLLFGLIALAMNFGSYWFSADIVLKATRSHQITRDQDPRLFEMVEELAGRAGMPMPRVYAIDSMQPNAFATGRNPQNAAVAVTAGIRQLLSERELRAVLGHELAHVRNRDILTSSVVAAIASAISMIAWMGFFFGGSRDGNGGGGLLALIVAPIAATLIQLGISRSREFEADNDGAEISGDPEALASALQRIEMGARRVPMDVPASTAHLFIANPFAGVRRSNLFATHPRTEERVARLMKKAGR
ncbi:MAG: M48 family metalloprotease [Dehalococcoidia bacterium]|nr:M48 family metalloprotease [Dehalococcoidia bacterium]